jgi:hypothetical protein
MGLPNLWCVFSLAIGPVGRTVLVENSDEWALVFESVARSKVVPAMAGLCCSYSLGHEVLLQPSLMVREGRKGGREEGCSFDLDVETDIKPSIGQMRKLRGDGDVVIQSYLTE